APAVLMLDSKLVANNAAATKLCSGLGCELVNFAAQASQALSVDNHDMPSGAWHGVTWIKNKVTLSLRAQALPGEGAPHLILAQLSSRQNAANTLLPEEDLLACLDELPMALHIRDAKTGRYLYANRAELRDSGHHQWQELIGKTPEQVFSDDRAAVMRQSDQQLRSIKQGEPQILKRRLSDTQVRESRKLLYTHRDMPLIVRTAQEVSVAVGDVMDSAQTRRIESIARVGSYRLDTATEQLNSSKFARELLGLEDASRPLNYADLLAVFAQEEADKLHEIHQSLVNGAKSASVEVKLVSAEVSPMVLEVRLQAKRGSDGEVCQIFGAVLDVTDRVENERRMRFLAYHDSLTKLPNRAMFMEKSAQFLTESASGGELFALQLVDLDGFKKINDQLGHLVGDRVLQVVAERLVSNIRSDDLAFRLGGDEFAVLHRGIHAAQNVAKLGDRLVRVLSEPIDVGEERMTIGASIGGALFANDASMQHVILRADEALYDVKRAGKGAFKLAA
ncbi:MAG: diguanylate cyclase domain-containing protein, partial [Granulosicoccaceae bacterium]